MREREAHFFCTDARGKFVNLVKTKAKFEVEGILRVSVSRVETVDGAVVQQIDRTRFYVPSTGSVLTKVQPS